MDRRKHVRKEPKFLNPPRLRVTFDACRLRTTRCETLDRIKSIFDLLEHDDRASSRPKNSRPRPGPSRALPGFRDLAKTLFLGSKLNSDNAKTVGNGRESFKGLVKRIKPAINHSFMYILGESRFFSREKEEFEKLGRNGPDRALKFSARPGPV